jgi:hypothetical protein
MMNIVEGSEGSDSSPEVVPHGSMPGRARNIDRERHMGHERMFANYFANFPVYGAEHFRRRYRMQHSFFLMIIDRVCECDDYFVQKRDACGLWGLSSIQKCTATLYMLEVDFNVSMRFNLNESVLQMSLYIKCFQYMFTSFTAQLYSMRSPLRL